MNSSTGECMNSSTGECVNSLTGECVNSSAGGKQREDRSKPQMCQIPYSWSRLKAEKVKG